MRKQLKAWEPSNATGGVVRYGVDSDDPSMLVYKTDKDWYWAADLCGGGETFTGHEFSKEAAIAAAEASPHGFALMKQIYDAAELLREAAGEAASTASKQVVNGPSRNSLE